LISELRNMVHDAADIQWAKKSEKTKILKSA